MGAHYGIRTHIDAGLDEAIERTTAALKEQGFGVLTRIDVHSTLKEKLDVEHRPYVILGACNPQLAHQGLEAEPELGLLLPCNVVVAQEDGGGCTVAAIDAGVMLGVVGNDALAPIASEAQERLQRALDALGGR